jgi:hypothetical protein
MVFINQSFFELGNVHLWTTKCGKAQPKNIAQEFDLSRLCYLCEMLLRHIMVGLQGKVAKNLGICLLFVILFQSSCTNSVESTSEKQALMLQYSDSLWQEHRAVTSLFRFKLDVIKERKTTMKATLQQLKFASVEQMNEENQANAVKYEAVYRVYRDIIEIYTQTVLRAEELFYSIKGLEKQIKSNAYGDGTEVAKLKQFKLEYAALKQKLDGLLVDATFIDRQLTAVEPAYQTVSPKVEALVEKNEL